MDYDPWLTQDPGPAYAPRRERSELDIPNAPYVLQNYPNPFNPNTTIEYGVSVNGTKVTIVVHDVSGRVVKELVNEVSRPGRFSTTWDGRSQ